MMHGAHVLQSSVQLHQLIGRNLRLRGGTACRHENQHTNNRFHHFSPFSQVLGLARRHVRPPDFIFLSRPPPSLA
jgi:hypothetical protein